MSVHDKFTHTKRMILVALLVPWAIGLAIALTGATDHSRLFSTIGLISVVVLILAIACVYFFAFRCPRCRKSLAMISNRGGWSFPSDVRYCPYCGLNLEVDTDELRHA
jgi:hypothetical protein